MPSVPFVRPLSASLPVRLACRVEGTVSGRIRRYRRCPEGCPIMASIVDAGHDRVDIWTGTRLADVRASSMGADGHAGWVPALVAAGVGRRRACALSPCPVRARMGGQRGWPWPAGQAYGRTLGGGGVRRLAVAVRTGSVPIGWALTLNWDVGPTGRSRGPPCPSPGQPLPGVRRRNWSTGRCPGGCPAAAPWRKRAASRTAGMSGTPRAEVLEVPTRRSRVGCAGRRAAPARRPTSTTDRATDDCGRRGGSVGFGKWLSSVGASGPGLCSAAGSPLAAGESLGTSCSDRASIKNSKDTSR
jgi:hypothetical protein